VEIDSGKVIGVEALRAGNNPELGEVVPARFIPWRKTAVSIVPIGAWGGGRGVSPGADFAPVGMAELTMSVNLSALQFRPVPV